MLKALLIATLVAYASAALAETLTAVCKDPKGRAVGIEGSLSGNKPVDEPEGMRGGQVTIVWDVGHGNAQVVVQGAGGGLPQAETATHVHTSNESVSFLVTYPAAVWLYSLYLKPKRLLITQHTSGFAFDSGGAIAKAMEAKCDMSLKRLV